MAAAAHAATVAEASLPGGVPPPPRGAGRRRKNRAPGAASTVLEISPLYKTRPCHYFAEGTGKCRAGPFCAFAHGEEDLRPSPDLERTSVCPTFLRKGACEKPHCRYAHSSADLRSNVSFMKTKLCGFFLEGTCIVGQACRFAHCLEELQEAATVQQVALSSLQRSKQAPKTKSQSDGWQRRRFEFGGASTSCALNLVAELRVPKNDPDTSTNTCEPHLEAASEASESAHPEAIESLHPEVFGSLHPQDDHVEPMHHDIPMDRRQTASSSGDYGQATSGTSCRGETESSIGCDRSASIFGSERSSRSSAAAATEGSIASIPEEAPCQRVPADRGSARRGGERVPVEDADTDGAPADDAAAGCEEQEKRVASAKKPVVLKAFPTTSPLDIEDVGPMSALYKKPSSFAPPRELIERRKNCADAASVASAPAKHAHREHPAAKGWRGRSRFGREKEQSHCCVWAGGRHGVSYELVPSDECRCGCKSHQGPCAHCGAGIKLITKNTFLDFTDGASADEAQGSRRRARSL